MNGKSYLLVLSVVAGITSSIKGFNEWVLVLLVTILWISIRQANYRQYVLFSCVLVFIGSFLYSGFRDSLLTTHYLGTETTFVGKITSIPFIDGDRVSFRFRTSSSETLQATYYIKSEQEQNYLKPLTYGMTCQIAGELREPLPAANFYSFDYKTYLFEQDIHWLLTARTLSLDKCLNKDLSVYDSLQQLRHRGLEHITSRYPESLAGIVSALIFGERRGVDNDLLTSYQSLGIIHLLAVSGLHVGLIVTTLFFIFIRIGITRERSYEVLLCILPLYVIIAGAAPSVMRASGMTFLVLLLLRYQCKLHPLDGISYICLLLLIINPFFLFQLGFQLSFIVSFTLIVSAQTVMTNYHTYGSQLLVVTIISQLVAFPLILTHFFEISLWSIPLNLVYIPFVSFFVLPFSFITLIISYFFPSLAEGMIFIFNSFVDSAHSLLFFFKSLPFGELRFGKPSFIVVALLYGSIFFGLLRFEKNAGVKKYIWPSSIFVLICLFQWTLPYLMANGEVVVLDVGQGDSILIELPYRKEVYLIDVGGQVHFGSDEPWKERRKEFDVGYDIVLQHLKARGIRKIDRLILTHGDFDHMGGAMSLFGNVDIEKIFYNKHPELKHFEKEFLYQAMKRRISIQGMQEGDSWKVEKANFYVLSPAGGEHTTNDSSIVIASKLGGLYWLFAGDLEATGEKRLVKHYPFLRADVLKVGHHGSRTSSTLEFIQQLQPKVALISAGRNNRFQHPHKEVVERFLEHKVRLYQTKEVGAIRYRFRGTRGEFETAID